MHVKVSCCPLQMESSCILSSSYPAGCALPNGNAAAPPAVQMPPGPETLSILPDPAATGFYLWPGTRKRSGMLWLARRSQWQSSLIQLKQNWRNVGLYVFVYFVLKWFITFVYNHAVTSAQMSSFWFHNASDPKWSRPLTTSLMWDILHQTYQ